MEPIDPRVNWDLDGKLWDWPAWKFDLERGDLFTTLHHRYNTVEIPLQDFYAFYHDVRELADKASTRVELDHLLAKRQAERTKELLDQFRTVSFEMFDKSSLIEEPIWSHCTLMFRTRSLAAIVMFFAGFFPNSQYQEENKSPGQSCLQPRPSCPNGGPMPPDSPESSRGAKAVEGEGIHSPTPIPSSPKEHLRVNRSAKLGDTIQSSYKPPVAEIEADQSATLTIGPSPEKTRADPPPNYTHALPNLSNEGSAPSSRKRKFDRSDSMPWQGRLRKRKSPTSI